MSLGEYINPFEAPVTSPLRIGGRVPPVLRPRATPLRARRIRAARRSPKGWTVERRAMDIIRELHDYVIPIPPDPVALKTEPLPVVAYRDCDGYVWSLDSYLPEYLPRRYRLGEGPGVYTLDDLRREHGPLTPLYAGTQETGE